MAAAIKSTRNIYKLFVNNLPWTIGHNELKSYFKEFGRVLNANVVFDKKTGLSKGYGFVVFSNLSAIEKIENKGRHYLEGNNINVQKA